MFLYYGLIFVAYTCIEFVGSLNKNSFLQHHLIQEKENDVIDLKLDEFISDAPVGGYSQW